MKDQDVARVERLIKIAVPFMLLCAIVSIVSVAALGTTVLDQKPKVDENAQGVEKLEPRARANTRRSMQAKRLATRAHRRVTVVQRRVERVRTVLVRAGLIRTGRRGAAGEQGIQGLQGLQGLVGRAPTPEEIDAAVARYCSDHVCGFPPTPEQVAAAVNAYCNDNRCGPTLEQVARAIVSYCDDNPCRGLDGPRGEKGEDGADGVDGAPGPPGPPGSLVLSVATCLPGEVATDPEGDGNYTTCGPPT